MTARPVKMIQWMPTFWNEWAVFYIIDTEIPMGASADFTVYFAWRGTELPELWTVELI